MDRHRLRQAYLLLLLDTENSTSLVQNPQEKRRDRRRRVWVRPWLQRRPLLGQYERLMVELRDEDIPAFRNFVRVEPAMFHELMCRLDGRIRKTDTWFRKALDPGLKLAITLRYLGTGDSYHSLMYGFRVAHNTISLIVREVCEAIIAEYAGELVACPITTEGWLRVANEFESKWQISHALGAIDGKHISIRCPKNGGSIYYNYKGFHSIVLLALVDADYKFLWAEAGSSGSSSDAQIFNSTELKETIEDGSIGFPLPDPLPGDDRPMPYFILGDDAFALRTWLMKPVSKRQMSNEERILNYRISRGRRVVENAFGILSNRFQCLLTKMRQEPTTVETIVLACVCLHNLMRTRYPAAQNAALDQEDGEHRVIPGSWRDGLNIPDMDNIRGGNYATRAAKAQREYLMHYYNSPVGAVPWQHRMI